MPRTTPTDLDPIFARGSISPNDYKSFWVNYWSFHDALENPELSAFEKSFLNEEISDLIDRYNSSIDKNQATVSSFLKTPPSSES